MEGNQGRSSREGFEKGRVPGEHPKSPTGHSLESSQPRIGILSSNQRTPNSIAFLACRELPSWTSRVTRQANNNGASGTSIRPPITGPRLCHAMPCSPWMHVCGDQRGYLPMNKSVSGLFDLVPTSCTVLRAFIKDIAPSFFTGWPDSREPALHFASFRAASTTHHPKKFHLRT